MSGKQPGGGIRCLVTGSRSRVTVSLLNAPKDAKLQFLLGDGSNPAVAFYQKPGETKAFEDTIPANGISINFLDLSDPAFKSYTKISAVVGSKATTEQDIPEDSSAPTVGAKSSRLRIIWQHDEENGIISVHGCDYYCDVQTFDPQGKPETADDVRFTSTAEATLTDAATGSVLFTKVKRAILVVDKLLQLKITIESQETDIGLSRPGIKATQTTLEFS